MSYAISDCGRILYTFGTYHTREEAQDKIDSLSYFGDLLEVVELPIEDINTEHVNDR